MTSPAQRMANQENAKKSTGPKSPEGKAIVSRNAVKHGLTAQHIVLPCEDPAEFESMQADLMEDYAPATAEEGLLADHCCAMHWMLKRGVRVGQELFIKGGCSSAPKNTPAPGAPVIRPAFFSSAPQSGDCTIDSSSALRRHDAAATSPLGSPVPPPAPGSAPQSGDCAANSPLLANAFSTLPKEFSLLLRYNTGHLRDLLRSRAELHRLQKNRAATSSPDSLLTTQDSQLSSVNWHDVVQELYLAAATGPQDHHPLPETYYGAYVIWVKQHLMVCDNPMPLEPACMVAAQQVALDMRIHNVFPQPGTVWGHPDGLAEWRAKSPNDGVAQKHRDLIRKMMKEFQAGGPPGTMTGNFAEKDLQRLVESQAAQALPRPLGSPEGMMRRHPPPAFFSSAPQGGDSAINSSSAIRRQDAAATNPLGSPVPPPAPGFTPVQPVRPFHENRPPHDDRDLNVTKHTSREAAYRWLTNYAPGQLRNVLSCARDKITYLSVDERRHLKEVMAKKLGSDFSGDVDQQLAPRRD